MRRKSTVTTPYKKLDEVPYELTEPVLIRMQKLERGLKFVLDNLSDEDLTQDKAAEAAGFTTRYFLKLFREHFGIPFRRYVAELRLRQAARDIRDEHYPKGVGARYGFTTLPSFTRAFRREFGISPREFYYGSYTIPDMPFPEEIEGLSIRLEYKQMNAFSMEGLAFPVPRGNDTYLMDALAFPFTEEGNAVLAGEQGTCSGGGLICPEGDSTCSCGRELAAAKSIRGGAMKQSVFGGTTLQSSSGIYMVKS